MTGHRLGAPSSWLWVMPQPHLHHSPQRTSWVRGEEPPSSRRRVNRSATAQAAVTRTRGSAAGTAALCQASKGSCARRGNPGRHPLGAAYAAPRPVCGVPPLRTPAAARRGRTGRVTAVQHPPSPVLRGRTWPWACRGAPGAGGSLGPGDCVTRSRSGWCSVCQCPAGPGSAVEQGREMLQRGFGLGAVMKFLGCVSSALLGAFSCRGQLLGSPRAFLPPQTP